MPCLIAGSWVSGMKLRYDDTGSVTGIQQQFQTRYKIQQQYIGTIVPLYYVSTASQYTVNENPIGTFGSLILINFFCHKSSLALSA